METTAKKILERIVDGPYPIELRGGEFLFRDGDPADYAYFLERGELKILKKNRLVWLAAPHEFIGISSFIHGDRKYDFSVKARTDCFLYRIPGHVFKKALFTDAAVSRFIMEMLCDRIHRTDTRRKNLAGQTPKYRLITEIVSAANKYSSKKIMCSVEELAAMVGVSPRLIRKILSELEEKGLLERNRDELLIHDLKGLEIAGRIK